MMVRVSLMPTMHCTLSLTKWPISVAGFRQHNLAHCDGWQFAHIIRIARGIWVNGERRDAVIFDF
jgi:hypothetical protein